MDFTPCLKTTFFLDYNHQAVQKFAANLTQNVDCQDKIEVAKILYLAVRDGFPYNPYRVILHRDALKASYLLTKDSGYCIEKAVLLAAMARLFGIPSRLGFANVRNHLGTGKIERILGTNVLVFHGYCELFLNERWVKATPAFNKGLCEKFSVPPLEFNGLEDSVFQSFSPDGNIFMEYLKDHGVFEDMPFDLFKTEFITHYGHLIGKKIENMYVMEEISKD